MHSPACPVGRQIGIAYILDFCRSFDRVDIGKRTFTAEGGKEDMMKARYNSEKLRRAKNCLLSQRTPDSAARRRNKCPSAKLDEIFGTTPFEKDTDMICSSPAFNRLDGKTQVMPAFMAEGIPVTRLIHCIAVGHYSAITARYLGLNSELCRAAGLGHDLGHFPFGHVAEDYFKRTISREIRHEIIGPIIMQMIENGGRGYSLTAQVYEAIARHSRKAEAQLGPIFLKSSTLEAPIIMYLDEICYSFYDAANFEDAGIICDKNLAKKVDDAVGWFGATVDERIRTCIAALCIESARENNIYFGKSEIAQHFYKLKEFLYKEVYYALNRDVVVVPIISRIYDSFTRLFPDCDPVIMIALLTDITAGRLAATNSDTEFLATLNRMPLIKYIPVLRGKKFDLTDPGLDW